MIEFSPALKQAISADVTTLCYCWKLTRKDGVTTGFTDHDQTILMDGMPYKPNSGFTAKEAEAALGLTIGNGEIEGALDDAEITAADLAAGVYDGAAIALFLVNWQTPAEFALLKTAFIARIEQADGIWRAELEGDAADFNVKRGRLFRKGCDAELGDLRCGVVLNTPAFFSAGSVGALRSANEFEVNGLAAFDSGWFADGSLNWTSGPANAGSARISSHLKTGSIVVLTLRDEPRFIVAAGTTFNAKAGCDKSFATCKSKFSNSLNFRGFPHMPGNDQAYSYARDGMNFDGGPVVE